MLGRSVSFNVEASQMVVVEKLYSVDDEKHILWYTHSDVKVFRKEATEEDAGECERKACWKSLVQGVLAQQLEQKRMGVSDEKGLRSLSRACSKKACRRAYRDAVAIAEELNASSNNDESPTHKLSVSTATYNTNITVHRVGQKPRRRSFIAVSA